MNKRDLYKRLMTALIVLLVLPSFVLAENADNSQVKPVFTEGSVHDPSVIQVNDTYYVFGSHLASAKTNDFMNWELVASGVDTNNPLFDDVTEELKEALDWAESDTLWATDVIELNGKFYMYYNACKGDSPRSAMGVAVADHVEGPYEDKGIFLKSGMWNKPSEDGEIYDANIHPNVIDPDAFFDAEGNLWMVYGSYSGGIFILEMDVNTGFPLEGQGYGTKLMGGNHSRMEGPYIQYVPETEYYYLHITYGGLSADGGYNMRVARSENPDGPYVDAEGNEMIDAHGPDGSFFDDEAIEPYGVKLMGNYLFEGPVSQVGYLSPGHNSVFYDEQSEEQLLLFHTRFPNRGEQHEIRVHQIFMNEEAWPVVAPYRYTAKEQSAVSNADIVGNYQFINHGKDTTDEIKKSIVINLDEDGGITGEVNGTWEKNSDNFITLNLEDGIYKGVLSHQWDESSENYVLTFSALSEQGIAVWGSKMVELSSEEIVAYVKDNLRLGNMNGIFTDITLPNKGDYETEISWKSSNPEIVSDQGIVNRPDSDSDGTITLTATISKGTITDTKNFTVIVKPQTEGGLVAHFSFDDHLENNVNQQEVGVITGNRIDNTDGTISFGEGRIDQAAVFDGSSGIRLPNELITSNKYTISLWLNPEEMTDFTTTFFGATSPENWLSLVPKGHDGVDHNTMVWSGEDWYDADLGLKLPLDEWTHVALTVDEGSLDVYLNGIKEFSGTEFPNIFTSADAVFGLGVNYWDTPYKGLIDELLIYDDQVLSEEEIMNYYSEGTIPGIDNSDKEVEKDEEPPKAESSPLMSTILLIGLFVLVLGSIIFIIIKRKK